MAWRIGLGISMGFSAMSVHRMMPKANLKLFYVAEYLLNATYVYFLLVYVGRVGSSSSSSEKEEEERKRKNNRKRS